MRFGVKYTIRSHDTTYSGVRFRSRLEARWACMFDLGMWAWQYEPIDLAGWSPDFRVEFPCGHSDCPATHTLLVEVKPYFSIDDFVGHPCMDYPYGGYPRSKGGAGEIPAHASAAFGAAPSVTHWEMTHGAGGGVERIQEWMRGDLDEMWKKAGNVVRYEAQRSTRAN